MLKIECRIEDGDPCLIIYTWDGVQIYTRKEGHADISQREYVYSLKKPQTAEELASALMLLRHWCGIAK